MARNFLSAGTMLQGKYQIVRILDSGGMGAVYLAQHIALGYVAVKEMFDLHTDPALRSQAIQQFQQGARLLFNLRHDNLPRVSDFSPRAVAGTW
jgi:serine/threonine-protein kinase